MIVGLQEWVETQFDVTSERQTSRGFQVFAVCPFCGKTKDHFAVNIETGVYACYVCGDGHKSGKNAGSYVNLVLEFESSLSGPSVVGLSPGQYYYAKKKKVDRFLKSHISDISISDLERLYASKEPKVEGEFKTTTSLLDAVEGTKSLDEPKGFSEIARYYLKTRGISLEQAREIGMVVGDSGRYLGYLLIPVWEAGKIRSFVARSMVAGKLRYTGPSLQENWTPKSQLLFGIDRVKQGKPCILVEGMFDALALWDLTTVGLLGKIISTDQTAKLIHAKPSRITVLLDAGFDREAWEVASHFVGFIPEIRIAKMDEEGIDPSDSPSKAAQAIINSRSLFE